MASLKERLKAFANPKVTTVVDGSPTAARYYQLCDQRDQVNQQIQPLKDRLARVNAEIQAKQAEAEKLAGEINAKRGGAEWITLKKEIAQIARFLVRIPPRESINQ